MSNSEIGRIVSDPVAVSKGEIMIFDFHANSVTFLCPSGVELTMSCHANLT